MICISDEYRQLFVGGLEKTMTKEKLKAMFPNSESIVLPMNYNNAEIRGWVHLEERNLHRNSYLWYLHVII